MSHHPRRAWMVIPFSKLSSRPLFQCFQSPPTLLTSLATHFTDHLWWAESSSKWNLRHYSGHYNSPRTRRRIGAPLHATSSLIQYTLQRQFLQNCEFPLRKHRECKQFKCPDLFRRMMHYHDSIFPAPKATSQQTWQDIVGQRQAAFRPLWAALEKTKDGSKGQQIHTWPGRGIIGYD